MNTRPRLVKSFPYWLLLVASLAAVGYGTWLIFDKIGTMTSTLTAGTATGVEVYAGQSWIMFGAAFVAAGLVGLVVTLALAVVAALVRAAPAPETRSGEEDVDDELDAADGAIDAAAPVGAPELAEAPTEEAALSPAPR